MNMGKSVIDFNEKKGFICDMDGVIYHGNQILPGVPEFIQWLHDEKKEYLFLTNNSGYTPRELNQKLARMGLDVPEEHFYTSALATAAFLKEQAAGCSVFVIGEAGLLNALYDVGITMNDVNPDYVVVGEGRSYSLDTLTKATNLVLKGAKLIGANSDVSGPIENGIAPACRALIAPIEMATGTQAYFCGKPNPLMMRTGLNMLGCHSAEAVMVGDRMDTDVISGMESGMSTVLVLSGCSTKDTLKTYAYLPTMVLNGVGDIASIAKAKEKQCSINGKRHASPHLFLIMEIEKGILLSSYEIPKGEDKNTFSYDSMKKVDYAKLKKSEKFTPALYHEQDGIWEGGSTSQFSPVMTFKLWEKFSDDFLEVSESMEVNGKRTFGYDEPIIYKRV